MTDPNLLAYAQRQESSHRWFLSLLPRTEIETLLARPSKSAEALIWRQAFPTTLNRARLLAAAIR